MATLQLRPRSVTEIVDASFELMRQNYVPLLTLAFAAQIPVVILRIWLGHLGLFQATAGATAGAMPANFMRLMTAETIGPLAVGFLVVMVVTIILQAALNSAGSEAYLGRAPDPATALRKAMSRFGTIVGSFLLLFVALMGVGILLAVVIPLLVSAKAGAASIVLFLAVFIGFIYVAVRLMLLLYPVWVNESLGPLESLQRVWSLGAGRFWQMFFTLLLVVAIYIGVLVIIMVAVSLLGTFVPPLRNPNTAAILQSVGSALIQPFAVMAMVVLYFDLRIRKEGFDVEMSSRDLGSPAAR